MLPKDDCKNTNYRNLYKPIDFDHLKANIGKINSKGYKEREAPCFLSFSDDDYKSWLKEKIIEGTRLVIEPKIEGSAIRLSYKNGKLTKAITKDGINRIDSPSIIGVIPFDLPINFNIKIIGELYRKKITEKNLLLSLKEKRGEILKSNACLAFCAYNIFNCELNQSSQKKELIRLGFRTPEIETTTNKNNVNIYLQLWREKRIFTKYPSSGIIAKVNSKKLQKQMERSSGFAHWGIVIS